MYQTYSAFSILLYIATDFVNLSPIIAFSGANASFVHDTTPNIVAISKGSPTVAGK